MGWYGRSGNFKNAKEYFAQEFANEIADGKIRAFSAGKREKTEWGDDFTSWQTPVFCAYTDNDGQSIGMVVLVREDRRKNGEKEWFYKSISENEGPSEIRCPEKILKLLDATDNEYALEWRQKCWRNLGKEMPVENPVTAPRM